MYMRTKFQIFTDLFTTVDVKDSLFHQSVTIHRYTLFAHNEGRQKLSNVCETSLCPLKLVYLFIVIIVIINIIAIIIIIYYDNNHYYYYYHYFINITVLLLFCRY